MMCDFNETDLDELRDATIIKKIQHLKKLKQAVADLTLSINEDLRAKINKKQGKDRANLCSSFWGMI